MAQPNAFDWMIMPLKRYADFRGRSRRSEFWWWTLFYYIVTILLVVIMFSGVPFAAFDPYSSAASDLEEFTDFGATFWLGGSLAGLFFLATIIPNLAVTVRRLHDRGLSGWWYAGLIILSFVPVIGALSFFGFIALLVVCILPGEDGPNRWGPDPKDPSQASVFD